MVTKSETISENTNNIAGTNKAGTKNTTITKDTTSATTTTTAVSGVIDINETANTGNMMSNKDKDKEQALEKWRENNTSGKNIMKTIDPWFILNYQNTKISVNMTLPPFLLFRG